MRQFSLRLMFVVTTLACAIYEIYTVGFPFHLASALRIIFFSSLAIGVSAGMLFRDWAAGAVCGIGAYVLLMVALTIYQFMPGNRILP